MTGGGEAGARAALSGRMAIGLLASHGGSNMQAIVDACTDGTIDATPAVVISNNSTSLAMQRARAANIPTVHISSVTHPVPDELDREMCTELVARNVDLVVLAGYMKRIGPTTLSKFANRIINVHPSLLPAFGGQGMFGRKVHEAVLASGVKKTGVTVHLVDGQYDQGVAIAQTPVPILEGDTVETLAERVLGYEHALYVDTIRRIANGDLVIPAAPPVIPANR